MASAALAVAKSFDSTETLSLVDRMRSGDEAAFNQLYRKNYTRVIATVRRYVMERDTAEYIANGVFARVWEVRNQPCGFRGSSAFATWVTRVAITEALMYLRGEKRGYRGGQVSLDEMIAVDGEEGMKRELSMRDLRLEGVVDRANITHALTHVPILYRTVFIMREIQGMDNADVSAVLGVPVSTVKSRLYHCKLRLKAILQRY